MARLNNHDPRSIDYRLQAVEDAAQADAAPFREKNERERCYSDEDIARIAEAQAGLRYMNTLYTEGDPEFAATKDTYTFVFRNVARRMS